MGALAKPAPADLLTGLLTLYWSGGVTQEHAARLVGIRKSEFVELAALRHFVLILEAAAWRYYLRAFNACFPECDRALAYRDPAATHGIDRRMYTDAELMASPDRDRFLGAPH